MFRLVVLGYLSVAIQGKSTPSKIFGGNETTIDRVPWQVAIEEGERFTCGGSIISPNYILTAAHCTNAAEVKYLRVRSGTGTLSSGGTLTEVMSYAQHPGFDMLMSDYDVSVVRLAEPLTFDENQQAVTLRKKEATKGEIVLATGWGVTEAGERSEKLRAVQLPVINHKKCYSALYGDITDRMICAGARGRDSCEGDYGGAVTIDNAQVGIGSWGYGCGEKYPHIFANVAALADFINEHSNNEAQWV